MPFKRPAPARHDHPSQSGHSSRSNSSVEDDTNVPIKRSKISKPAKALPEVKLYIVQAKMHGPELAELILLAEQNCERLCSNIEEANVVVTAVTMGRRFERHVSWELAVRALEEDS
jgi:DNA polymerase IV